ncbi:MAG TPA: BrnT family toxin [Anaerolineales bacterium]|nr:BrnT family toxin [Anaerolineales bacterium]HMS00314.1 BrnT family toxin [Anaerolineales bacterium]HNQ96301.1 BrnT family toxin [Anaerolineales bacterium]HNS60842.1 BrnT family toxin [Anaerolineales bacterium]
MQYEFDWDPVKARQNLQKHGVSFERAARIFLDPFAISIFDEPHSENEDRWVTIGAEANEVILIVIHTFRNMDAEVSLVRIISARKATREEAQQYHERR